jgi:hypothetical protein
MGGRHAKAPLIPGDSTLALPLKPSSNLRLGCPRVEGNRLGRGRSSAAAVNTAFSGVGIG